MAKRYAFWMTSQGKPARSGNASSGAPTATLREIGVASKTRDGKPSWSDFSILRYQTLIGAVLVVLDDDDVEMNDADKEAMVQKALNRVLEKQGTGKAIDSTAFLTAVDYFASQFYRESYKAFLLISSISTGGVPTKRLTCDGCTIEFIPSRAKYPVPESLASQSAAAPFLEHLDKSEYQTIRVRVHGRSATEAADKGLDAVSFLRGLWSLAADHGRWRQRFGIWRREPIGTIHSGPIHTVHNLDGQLARDIYWYSPHYTVDQKLFSAGKAWPALNKQRRRWERQIITRPYAKELRELILRYTAALDQQNLDLAFLQMWSILETLTNTQLSVGYEQTIKRAAWGFAERALITEALECLRCNRNRLVHAGRSGSQADAVVYLVKSMVDPHLLRLIENRFNVSSLAEYGELLSLPPTLEKLKQKQRMLRKAVQIAKWTADHEQKRNAP